MTGPLDGIRVLDVSTILAGPLVAQILGDFGADVVKIEHPSKPDGMRGHGLDKDGHPLWWTMVSRNKRGLTLNLGNPDGAEVFKRLVADVDVVVENFRPGTFERWGLGYDVLSAINPGLILLRVTGFGQTGPYATRPAFGTLVESMSGFAHLTGEADGPPTLPAFGLADSLAGIAGSSAVSMALLHRHKTGRGQEIDLDLLSPIMTAVGPGVIYADQLGIDQERTGNRSTNNAPRNLYRTKDGHWLAISTSANSIAERVLRLVGHPEVLDEPWFATGRQRAAHADLLDDYVGGWIGERTRDEVIAAFEDAGAAVAPVYKPSELLDDPQVTAIEMVTTVDDEDLGPVRMQNVMWRMGESPGSIRHTGRAHGADTDEILAESGYSAEEIVRLREVGAV
ncbi:MULTISPECIES: CaiB/BaiF CoA transferase family protein [Nocardiaceae]|uniref:CoA transferase n=1 Tax=Rhodococcoides kroppenstedtii TaxID=293050 RepID=A0ABS7NT97_9NOCA|nr:MULTISPECIES: CoA transferase [Rhodococcus]AMY17983.1 Succinyl-CoA--L-malate CoA-transferase beta subunit [Rhodococcus sp. PBTS 1]MBY6313683.1 CoA transferase [Rhodococcus kroppenstedtii]MBY6320937.1 CoA transferase [Rhodococcus kroppenstedtii]MBY6401624.1 CoA transferase [Rhodococcus kroppenstedtii]